MTMMRWSRQVMNSSIFENMRKNTTCIIRTYGLLQPRGGIGRTGERARPAHIPLRRSPADQVAGGQRLRQHHLVVRLKSIDHLDDVGVVELSLDLTFRPQRPQLPFAVTHLQGVEVRLIWDIRLDWPLVSTSGQHLPQCPFALPWTPCRRILPLWGPAPCNGPFCHLVHCVQAGPKLPISSTHSASRLLSFENPVKSAGSLSWAVENRFGKKATWKPPQTHTNNVL